MITRFELKELLHYDPETGIFTWLVSRGRVSAGMVAGMVGSSGHVYVRIYRHNYCAHRLAWLYMTGAWPEAQVDHCNMIRVDNRWCNLREATNAQNNWNQGIRRTNTSGFKGVNWVKKDRAWSAKVRFNGERRTKQFKSLDVAVEWIKFVREELHGEYGRSA